MANKQRTIENNCAKKCAKDQMILYQQDLNLAFLNIVKIDSLSNFSALNNSVDIHLDICLCSNLLGAKNCDKFVVRCEPELKDKRIFLKNLRFVSVDCIPLVPETEILNYLKKYFISDFPVVVLSGIPGWLAKSVYIGKDNKIKVSWGIF